LENGEGPTVLVRAELDALPVQEETALPYQSLVPGSMHACGHDVHMVVALASAQMLVTLADEWQGTLVVVGQPAEETGDGARTMIENGLFDFFPRPDAAISLHVSASKPAGALTYRKGYALANVDYVDVLFGGPGGHGAMPEAVPSPIDLGSEFNREIGAFVKAVNETGPAVVSFGSFHSGTEHNIIPKEARLQMTSRSYSADVRQDLENGIQTIADSVAEKAKAPRPKVVYKRGVPSLYNDPDIVDRLVPVFQDIVGKENVLETKPKMFGDDFSYYGYETDIPVFQFGLGVQDGGADPKSWPQAHAPKFAPQFRDSFLIGVLAMTKSVIKLMEP
jgi:hippurate hydrolase